MADRILKIDPPENCRQVGWHCVYHEQTGTSCHNPLDCDLVPVWTLKVEDAVGMLKRQPVRMQNE